MVVETIEVLALILIAITILKLIVIGVNSKAWVKFVGRTFKKPVLARVVLLVLAAVVLYALDSAGVSIVEILAVTLFAVLLIAVSFTSFIGVVMKKVKINNIWKDQWLSVVIWAILMVWGLVEIFN